MADHASGARKPRGKSATMAHRDRSADDRDFFPTPPWGARAGGELIRRLDPEARSVWEPACGGGHMVHGLGDYFERVWASDAYVYDRNAVFDFVAGADHEAPYVADWIVTNPPFALIDPFIRAAWRRARRGVAMLCRLAVLEGVARHQLLYRDLPVSVVAPFAERLPMGKGRYDPDLSSAAAYAWFVWLKTPTIHELPVLVPIEPGTRARLTRPSDDAFAMRGER